MTEIVSGRNRGPDDMMTKLASSNQSNFFPSFDSRGNIGVVEDANEFNPKKKSGTIDVLDEENAIGIRDSLSNKKRLPELPKGNSRSGSKKKLKTASN